MNTERLEWLGFDLMDAMRHLQGAALDSFGLGPLETPYEIALSKPGVRLRRYRGSGERGRVLLVPAPIKGPCIWDLAPGVSVVQRCLLHGVEPYLIEWTPIDRDLGLADYAESLLLDCLDAMGDRDAILVAHSLGGLFAALFAALHPARVRGLVLLATPVHFARDVGILAALVDGLQPDGLPASIPGSFVSSASFRAEPLTFGWERWVDFLQSMAEPEALGTHLRVERWTLDERPMPRRLVVDLAERFAHEDAFVGGTLEIGGRSVSPAQVTAPLLCVIDPRCRVVPPAAIMPFYDAAGSTDKTLLEYDGDVGVSLQHVGVLVGRRAHADLWPRILRWIENHAAGGATLAGSIA